MSMGSGCILSCGSPKFDLFVPKMEILPNANTEWDKMTSASPTLMSERAFSPELFDEQEETAPDAAREEKEYTSDMDLLEDDHASPNREASIDFAQQQSTSPPPHRSLSPSLQSPPPRKGSLQSPAWPLLSGAGTTLRTPPPQLPAGASRYAASPAFMEEEYDPDLMEDAGDFTPNPNGGMIGHHDDIEIPQEREDPSSCRLRKLEEQCRDQMEQMERLSTSLTEPLTRFKAEVEATTSEQQTRITTLEAECAALKAHQDSLERSLADLTERLARVEEQRVNTFLSLGPLLHAKKKSRHGRGKKSILGHLRVDHPNGVDRLNFLPHEMRREPVRGPPLL